jgi:hypothetical protein
MSHQEIKNDGGFRALSYVIINIPDQIKYTLVKERRQRSEIYTPLPRVTAYELTHLHRFTIRGKLSVMKRQLNTQN